MFNILSCQRRRDGHKKVTVKAVANKRVQNNIEICGKPIFFLLQTFFHCHNLTYQIAKGAKHKKSFEICRPIYHQWCFPDGRSYTQQQNIIVQIFDIMRFEAEKELKKKLGG